MYAYMRLSSAKIAKRLYPKNFEQRNNEEITFLSQVKIDFKILQELSVLANGEDER